MINGDSSASVTATASGAVVTLTAKSHGVSTDYSWSDGVQSYDSTDFNSASFGFSPASGALANGVNDYPDTGTITLTVGGVQNSAAYGSGSTAATIATALASAVNGNSSSLVTASASGGTVNLTEKTQGSTPTLSVTASTNYPTVFNPMSFAAAGSDEFLDATNSAPPASLLNPLVTLYSYDALDNLTCVEQHGNVSGTGCSSASSNDASSAWRVRRFTYDSLKRLVSVHNPESGTITYTYDADGNVLTKTDARSIVTTYTYDALHRLTQKSYSDGTHSVIIGYDGATISGCSPTLTTTNGVGRRTAMCDAAGWEAWSYDTRGHVVDDRRNTNSVTKDTTYAYNFAGTETSVTYPSGHTISYSYNAASQVTSASDISGGITYASNAHYAAPGELLSLQNSGSAIISTLYYNNRLQPCRISVNSSGSAPGSCTDGTNMGNVLDYTYGFSYGAENNGNVASITNNINTARSQSFTYDELNRISTAKTQATSGTYAWGLQFGYDPWANMLSASVSQGSAYALSASSTGQNRLSGYSYDASGNMLNDGTNTYTFDAESQLKTAAGVTYTYDGNGNRVQKSNGKLYWHGGGSDPLDETDASGNLTDEYIFFGGKRVARRDPSNNVDYYFADHLGTAHIVTNSSGTVQDDSDFYPFGGERPYLSSSGNMYKFTGQERDSESGLDNFKARYDSSTLGRFMSADELGPGQHPENPQSWNLYAYVQNNAMNLTDPTGQYVCDSKTVSQSQCDNFQKGLDKAQEAADKLKDKYGADSEKYKDAQRAIDAFGKQGINNGVTIAQGTVGTELAETKVAGNTVAKTADNPTGQNIRVTFDRDSHSLDGNAANIGGLAALEAHEGSHVADGSSWVSSGFDPNHDPTSFQTEHRAYNVTASIGEGLGATSMSLQDFKTGKTTFNSLLPLGTAGKQNLDRYIRQNYPGSNLAAFSRNTRIPGSQQ